MTPAPRTGAHPDDGVLLRLMDGESDADAAAAEEHLAACAECRERLAVLRRRTMKLGALLARADFPVPASSLADAPSGTSAEPDPKIIPLRRRETPAPRPWLRAAAVVGLLLAAGIVATPARAWVAAWISERWGELFGRGEMPRVERPAPPAAPAPVQEAAASRVEFVPAGATFTVEVAHPQARGGLTLLPSTGETATAEVAAGTGEADLLVLPSGLRIGNEAGSAAEYRVSVPTSVRRVTVRVNGRAETVETSRLGAEGRRIGLSP